jgi:hypothetical protein
MENFDFFKSTEDLTNYVLEITGQQYEFAEASSRRWGRMSKLEHGTFYQLIPDTGDDGFFDWYYVRKPDHQFFKMREECVMRFIKYWVEWKKSF